MLCRGEQIAPHLRGRVDIRVGFEIDVTETGVAPPVFGGCVRIEDAGHAASASLCVEKSRRLSGLRIFLRIVGERKQMPKARRRLPRGLSVAMVELAPASAGDVDEQTVEDLLLGHI